MTDRIKANIPTPGYYRLSKTIQNPHIDKRVKHDWWLLPQIPEDSRFMVESRMVKSIHDNIEVPQISVLRVWRDGSYSVMNWWCDGDKGTERWNLIAESLVPAETDLRGLFAKEGFHNLDFSIIEELMAAGKINLDDVLKAGNAAYDKFKE